MMKKVTVLFFALLTISASSIAKAPPILGNWLLTKVEMEGKTEEVNSEVNFKDDGYAEMAGRVFGTWIYNKKAKTVTIKSEMIEEFAGEWQFTMPKKNEVLLSSSNMKLFFTKLDEEKIGIANQESGFVGAWKVNLGEETMYMKFTTPNQLSTYSKTEYSSSQASGTWMADKENNSLVLIFNDRSLSGKSVIKSIDANAFTIEKNDNIIKGEKIEESSSEIEILAFTEDQIIESIENGEKDVSLQATNSTWLNPDAKTSYLMDIKTLKYKYSSLLEGINVFIAEDISANVVYDENYDMITIDPIFGEISASGPDGLNPFYPIEDLYPYRVTGNATITVPAGTFDCTVVESVGDWDRKAKFYMISNQPGVYAKIIISEGEDDEQKYSMYELTDIEGTSPK